MGPQLSREVLTEVSLFDAFAFVKFTTHAVTALALSALIAGGISCLARFEDFSTEDNWRFQLERLKTYNYIGASLLVIGVLLFKAWANYPAWALVVEQDQQSFNALVNATVVFMGVEFTIILSAYALPVALILSRRANEIAVEVIVKRDQLASSPASLPFGSDVQAVRKEKELTITTWDTLRTFATLLAPFITGSITSLTSVLG